MLKTESSDKGGGRKEMDKRQIINSTRVEGEKGGGNGRRAR